MLNLETTIVQAQSFMCQPSQSPEAHKTQQLAFVLAALMGYCCWKLLLFLENTVWFSFTTNSIGGDAQIDFSNMAFDLTAGFGSSLEAVIIEAGVGLR